MLARRLFAIALLLLPPPSLHAADEKAGIEYFEKHIRPVLVSKCYECHSSSSKEPKGNLLLDTREGIRMGGDSGEAVVPGQLADSVLLEAIRWEGLEMPPEEQLPPETIAKFEQWIKMGAQDPRDGKAALIRREIDFEKARAFWSFRPIANPKPPTVDSKWPRTEIDQFVARKQRERDVAPVEEASAQTLARRIYFDLVGLPNSFLSSNARPRRKVSRSPLSKRWMNCWRHLTSVSDGAGTGWTSCGTASRPAWSETRRSLTHGDIVIGSFDPSTTTNRTTSSSRSRSLATCCLTNLQSNAESS